MVPGGRVDGMSHPTKCDWCGKQFEGRRDGPFICTPCWTAYMSERRLAEAERGYRRENCPEC